jgi:hypothetical protein
MQRRFIRFLFRLVSGAVFSQAPRRRKAHLACMMPVLLLMLVMVSPARATMMTYDVTFSALNFSPDAPPVTGSFTITFDPTLTYTDATAPITSFSTTIAHGTVAIDYPFPGSQPDYLLVGGVLNGVDTLMEATDDFALGIAYFPTNPTFDEFMFTKSGVHYVYYDSKTVTGTVTPVPLPPAGLLLGAGLIGLAVARRRKRWGK